MTDSSPEPDQVALGRSSAGREELLLYTRTYRTVLRSSGEVQLRVLEAAHLGMRSSLHPLGEATEVDAGAMLYALHRLPPVVLELEHVRMGQSPGRLLFPDGAWQEVSAPGRRRRWWWDGGSKTLAVALASSSDLDDLVPTLTALQIEWNKAHALLRGAWTPGQQALAPIQVCSLLGISEDDWLRLELIFGPGALSLLDQLAARPMSLGLRLLGGSQVGFARSTREWWAPLQRLLESERLTERPLYFVSSNAHSLVNLLSGVARERAGEVLAWVATAADPELQQISVELRQPGCLLSADDFLYYAARRWFEGHPGERARRASEERDLGIFHLNPASGTDVAAQLIVLDRLQGHKLDPRLEVVPDQLARAPGVILNIQYPLGLGAYHILRQIMEQVEGLHGVYILGKAATLNADVGDLMISDVVHDEHSGNTYWIRNCFGFSEVAPYIRSRSVLDRQRAVSVQSTFLQNRAHLDLYYRDNYTVVEMEAGPYLGALYEASESARYPSGEQVDLTRPAVEFGLIHYASDTPYTQARTLGARGLRFEGMEATYAGALAIASRILQRSGAGSGTGAPG